MPRRSERSMRLAGQGFILLGQGPAGPFAFSGGDDQNGGARHGSYPLLALRNICRAALRYMFAFAKFAYNIAISYMLLKK